MKTRFLMLTKSRKHMGYCIAGINIDTGEWLRIIVEGMDLDKGVQKRDFVYQDGSFPNIMDCMYIDIIGRDERFQFQPENVIIKREPLKKIVPRREICSDVLRKRVEDDYNLHDVLFYNKVKRIAPDELQKQDDRYSLVAIQLKHGEWVKHTEINSYNGQSKTYIDVKYKDVWYKGLSITTETNINTNININTDNPIFIISLGEEYYGYHYKLVASIIGF